MSKRSILLAMIALATFVLPACNDGKQKTEGVTGVVTFNGAPLPTATVTFSPKQGSEGTGAIGTTDDQGVYKLQTVLGKVGAGTTPGSYEVSIKCEKVVDPGQAPDEDGNGGRDEVVESVIPAKYGKTATSGLTAEVVSGNNTINFDLTE